MTIHTCEECAYSTKYKTHMQRHIKAIHTNDRPYKCDICDAAFVQKPHLVVHKRVHTGEKPFKCDLCDAAFTTKCGLDMHTRTHTGERPYRCTECNATFVQSGHLTKHKKTHTPEYIARKKRSEERVRNVLRDAGYDFKSEHYIDFSCTGSGTFARIDVLLQLRGGIVMLEVDEGQHKCGGYSISCDMKRMASVMESLALEGNTLPVYWLRYNPTSYTIDGVKGGRGRADRERDLLSAIEAIDFTKPLWVHYMFYDTVEGDLAVKSDPEFHPLFKECASFHV